MARAGVSGRSTCPNSPLSARPYSTLGRVGSASRWATVWATSHPTATGKLFRGPAVDRSNQLSPSSKTPMNAKKNGVASRTSGITSHPFLMRLETNPAAKSPIMICMTCTVPGHSERQPAVAPVRHRGRAKVEWPKGRVGRDSGWALCEWDPLHRCFGEERTQTQSVAG